MCVDTPSTCWGIVTGWTLEERSPVKLHLFVSQEIASHICWDFPNRQSFIARTKQNLSKSRWMRKRIRFPCMLWLNLECILQEIVSCHKVHHKLLISWAGLIWDDPSPIDKLKTSILNKLSYSGLCLKALSLPPFLEINDFSDWKPTTLIPVKGFNHLCYDGVYKNVIVFIWLMLPSHFHVRMTDEMYCDDFTLVNLLIFFLSLLNRSFGNIFLNALLYLLIGDVTLL